MEGATFTCKNHFPPAAAWTTRVTSRYVPAQLMSGILLPLDLLNMKRCETRKERTFEIQGMRLSRPIILSFVGVTEDHQHPTATLID